jgi:hypothetical protein
MEAESPRAHLNCGRTSVGQKGRRAIYYYLRLGACAALWTKAKQQRKAYLHGNGDAFE